MTKSERRPYSSSMNRYLPWLFAGVMVVGMGWREFQARWWLATEFEPDPAHDVVLLSASWCGYCAQARTFFEKNAVRFTELDVERSDEGRNRYEATGSYGVPVVIVDGRPIYGMNVSGWVHAIERDTPN